MVCFEELLVSLQSDYPELKFRPGYKFKFRPPRTIYYELPLTQNQAQADQNYSNKVQAQDNKALKAQYYNDNEYNNYCLQLLHEAGHALLKHRDFATDLDRVKMECAAWQKAQELCNIYNIEYDEDFAEAELDSYRDWLHQRSTCKTCGLTCYQTPDGKYHCPMCEM